jgi:hypothetical protein
METTLLGRHSDAYPTSVLVARALSRSIVLDRAARQSWRAISEKMAITRIECIRLAYALPEVVEEIKAEKVKP